jgi:hypothetical protein
MIRTGVVEISEIILDIRICNNKIKRYEKRFLKKSRNLENFF